ncbi:hypothetical protein DAEQUDRAFT_667007 [Daedalea quercina L-15889]|uniref:Spo11/DNA topoisomerase VI subunit A N-terminal domain-containing protein n=1 Tax=Daedalea quercina L-15889 TaxID=1314783 RepID=A0A165RR28_9APHY|nr:hypothetical protein DAEQUDRAFT_667007 [Daedalea quercina L-15889]
MALNRDFSSNRHASPNLQEFEVPTRHSELCFDDGNLAIVTGRQYFLVHKSLLCYHSAVLREQMEARHPDHVRMLEGRPVLALQDTPEDMTYFLKALYGYEPDVCLFDLQSKEFAIISALLRMATKYGVEDLRKEIIRVLLLSWPTTLPLWEVREKKVTNIHGIYAPRTGLPHPLVIINLAREVDTPELLPSAFYDLSRYLPSQLTLNHISGIDGSSIQLSCEDLLRVLRGKEQAARFFSTFIVDELEGRDPGDACIRKRNPATQRACQVAFEAINFELIRDVNGMVCNRNSDPLFAIAESLSIQTREDIPGVENRAVHRACEACRLEYGAIVDALREDFWRRIPEWFELELCSFSACVCSPLVLYCFVFALSRPVTYAIVGPNVCSCEDWPDSHVFAAEDMHICEEGSPEIILIDEDEEGEDRSCIPCEGDEYREYDDVLHLLHQLEELCLSVLEQLAKALDADDGVVKAKKANRIVVELADRRRTSSNGSPGTRTLMFPRKGRGASIQPLAQLFRVVSLVHEALATGIPMTKRDMYYKDVELFKSQSVVDRLVDDLAATLGVGRSDLNVRASSKGLVCGSRLVIHLDSGDTVEVNDSEVAPCCYAAAEITHDIAQGTLIPAGEDITRFDLDDSLTWVLIVEKEVYCGHSSLHHSLVDSVPGGLSDPMPSEIREPSWLTWTRAYNHGADPGITPADTPVEHVTGEGLSRRSNTPPRQDAVR